MKIKIEATNWQSSINQLREMGITIIYSCKFSDGVYIFKGN